jgi:hemerythrin superfamily protein
MMSDTTSNDLIAQLREDHQQIERMFSDLGHAGPARAGDGFWDLTNELVRHEVAEEEIVYPQVRKKVPNGDRLATARIKEQAKAEDLLAKIEKAGVDDERFAVRVEKLRNAVLAHAQKEERLIFEPLSRVLDPDEREQLGALYHIAKTAAPTHPHPWAPDTPPGNVALGPVAALIDRARDAIHQAAS